MPLKVDPAMTPRLDVICRRALAAVNCARVTINGTEAIMAGPKIVEAIEFKNTSTKRCSTFNTPTGITGDQADDHRPKQVTGDHDRLLWEAVQIDADQRTE